MKRGLGLALAVLLMLQLTGCGKAIKQETETTDNNAQQQLQEQEKASTDKITVEDPAKNITLPKSDDEIWERLVERQETEGMTYLYAKELVKGFQIFKNLGSLPVQKGEVDPGQLLKSPTINTRYEVDLDGDGTKEEIVYYCLIRDQTEGNSSDDMELWEGGFEVPEGRETTSILQIGQVYYFLLANAQEPHIEDMEMAGVKDLLWIDFDFDNQGRFYVVDLDKTDDKKEVVATLISAGVVWPDAFIRYEGGGIRLMGKPYHGFPRYEVRDEDDAVFELPGDRTLQGDNVVYAIQTFMVTEQYVLNEQDEIEQVGEDYEELFGPGTGRSEGSKVELLIELPAYVNKDYRSESLTMQPGEVLFLKVARDGKWVYMKDATGQKGWISVEEYGVYVEEHGNYDNPDSNGIFRGLSYAG